MNTLALASQAISSRDAALRAYNSARAAAAAKKDKIEKLRLAGGKADKADVRCTPWPQLFCYARYPYAHKPACWQALARELAEAEESVRILKQVIHSSPTTPPRAPPCPVRLSSPFAGVRERC